MIYVFISAAVSAVVSVIVTKIIAAHYFNVVDSYVKDLIELAKQYMEDAYISQGKH